MSLNKSFCLKSFVLGMSLVCVMPMGRTVAQEATAEETAKSTEAKKTGAPAKPDPRIGTKVIVTVDSAPLRTPKEIVWKAYRGEVFEVSLTDGEWLWISKKRGWLWEKETVAFEEAIPTLTKAVTAKPTAENFDMRGIAHTAHENYKEAIGDFTKSLSRKPNVPGVLNNRGRAHYLAGDNKSAIADFDKAIRTNPKHFVAMLNRALCFMADDKLDLALRDLNAAIALNKDFPEALNNRGVIYSKKGQHAQAVADFSKALQIDKSYIDAYGNRASAYRAMKKYTEAKSDLQIAMKKDPLNYKPVNDLAWFFATVAEKSKQQPEEAVKLATKACEMTQYEDWNTLDTLAAAYAAKGDFKAAQQWITTALEKSPKDKQERLKSHQAMLLEERPIVK